MQSDLIEVTAHIEVNQEGLKTIIGSQIDCIERLNERMDEFDRFCKESAAQIKRLEDIINQQKDLILKLQEEIIKHDRSLFQKILDIFPKYNTQKRLKETVVKL